MPSSDVIAVVDLIVQSPNDKTEGNDYFECWKFTIKKQVINNMKINNKKQKTFSNVEKLRRLGKGKMMKIINMYIALFTTY